MRHSVGGSTGHYLARRRPAALPVSPTASCSAPSRSLPHSYLGGSGKRQRVGKQGRERELKKTSRQNEKRRQYGSRRKTAAINQWKPFNASHPSDFTKTTLFIDDRYQNKETYILRALLRILHIKKYRSTKKKKKI